ncbi:MAG: Gfo/Idh/MocA family oxidoreductase [Clostridiales bacterium]|nr:Gfo/Idh/MocA family oxidoreductase [Clostridiales bacterium]
MDRKFRFGIMGPGKIAENFYKAVERQGEGMVAAVASKDIGRARTFADRFGIEKAYGSYEKMLEEEELDAVYVAVTTNAHYEVTMLCLEHRVPVLCEKAMCVNSREAEEIFARSKELGVFVMEGMWSRFLPKMAKVKEWLAEEKIGKVSLVTCGIGFNAEKNWENRYYNPALGGGATYDILVYCYEIATDFFEQPPKECVCVSDWSESGVDRTDVVVLKYPGCLVQLICTFEGEIAEEMVFYGDKGRIVLPHPHYARECFLQVNGEEPVEFTEDQEELGFVYEIGEVIRCVREGKTESSRAPHRMTLEASRLYDRILEQRS